MTPAVGEFQYSVLIRGDWMNFRGSFAFNLVFLTVVFAIHMGLQAVLRSKRLAYMLLGLLTGLAGLSVEWFLIGNSPWGNPDASQPGMFAYWACMALVPLMFLMENHPLQTFILRYALVYVALALLGQFAISSPDWRFAFHIYAVIFGYLGLMIGILWKYLQKK